jgi:ABC-type phosphate/phosphonate transport system substrate-binding protein
MKGENKILGLQGQDYFRVREHVPLDLVFLPWPGGRKTSTYVVLVRDDSGIDESSHLRGRLLLTVEGRQMGLARIWLEVMLSEAGLGGSRSLLQSVKTHHRVAQAVLPVFFGTADACLVSRSGFETMAELNPQISQQLRVLASSPPVIPFVTCMRSDFTGIDRQRTEAAYLEAHLHAQGRQLLTLFGDDRDERCDENDLQSSLEIIQRHGQLETTHP